MVDRNTRRDSGVPHRTELSEHFESDVSKQVYEDYFRPLFSALYSLEGDETTTQADLYARIAKDVSSDTKRKRLKSVLQYDPSLIEKIADAPPRADAFVTYCANRLGFARTDIDEHTLNDVQQECERAGSEMRERHLEYHVTRLRNAAENAVDIEVPDEGQISVAEYREIVTELTRLVGDELPDELQSFNQRMIGIAGRANELIAIETLLARGLERETAFEDVTASNREEDIRVYTTAANGESLQVEVKSTGLRERGDAGAARIENPSAIFGFFNDATEVLGRADALEKHAVVVYLPPATLDEMREKNRTVYGMNSTRTEQLFFRANNSFPGDMEYYHSHGALPDRDRGHEQSPLD